VTQVTRPDCLAYSAPPPRFPRLLSSRSEWVATAKTEQESDMKTYFDDIATALVLFTYCVAVVSAAVAFFAGAM
jgi:hypothetical protein